jgi:hypothetical protein
MATLTTAQVQQYAQNAGFTGQALRQIVAIIQAESNNITTAHNPGGPGDIENSFGLAQINLDAHPEVSASQAEDPAFALDYAYKLYTAAGNTFTDWGTFNTGEYIKYLSTPLTTTSSPISPGGIAGGIANLPGQIAGAAGSAVAGDASNPIGNFFSGLGNLASGTAASATDILFRVVGAGIGLIILIIGLVGLVERPAAYIAAPQTGVGGNSEDAAGESGAGGEAAESAVG